jgi:CP family cyanate transporter-like MFS transporter
LPDLAAGRRGDLAWLVAIVLVALNLRAVITSVPPLALDLAADLNLSAVAVGALTTVPVACMGLFAPVAAAATRHVSQSTVLSAGVLLIVLGAGLRGIGGTAALFAATAVAGIGIAVAGTLLPGLVRTRTPDRVGPMTGIYTAALIGGAMVSSALAEPVRAWLGTTAQLALAVWALPALVALVAWMRVARKDVAASPRASSGGGQPLPWRDSSAWLGTGFMALQSLLFYGTLAWLPVSNMEHGMSATDAGLLLAVFSAAQVVTAFVVPALAHRTGDLRPWVVATLATSITGLLLVALVPYAFPAAPWLWAVLLGLGMGGHFALALNTITQLAPSAEAAPAYSGMAFLFGYGVAAVGPVLLGFLADATGGYRVPFLTLTAVGLITVGLAVAAINRAQARASSARA